MSKITLKIGKVCLNKNKCLNVPANPTNSTLHWGIKMRWKNAWQEAVGWEIVKNRHRFGKLPLPKPKISFVVCSTHIKDKDGLYASIKPLLDQFKDIKGYNKHGEVMYGSGVVIDDSPKYIDLKVEQIKVSHRIDEGVEINIEF
jgi:hypothetical protein